jgi:hypothetical protein
LLFVFGRNQWEAERKAEFYLCGWLAAGLGTFLITIQLPFYQYFILVTPFLSILASVGIVTSASWLRSPGRPAWLVTGVLLLFVAGVPSWLWQQRLRMTWPQVTEVARLINQIVPEHELIWGDAMISFAAKRVPISGLENPDSLRLHLSPEQAANLHVVSRADVYDWVTARRFAAIATCFATDEWIDESGIRKVYSERITIDRSSVSSHPLADDGNRASLRKAITSCDIFWSKH